jgi:hypothetical protein
MHEKESDQDLELDPEKKVVSILEFPEVQNANKELERRVDEVHARLARVQLLFGVRSPAGKAATDCILSLRKAQMHLQDWPEPEWRAAKKLLDEVTGLQEAFASAALDAIHHAQPGPRRRESPAQVEGPPAGGPAAGSNTSPAG